MAGDREHPEIPRLKRQLAAGEIDRREFLRYSTLLGLSAGAAYAFVGKLTGDSVVAPAQAALPQGGTIRIGLRVQEVKNPHAIEWIQPATITTNVLQPLAVTGQDNVTRPLLLERWQASDDLKTWTLHIRKEARWHSGRPFTADDVVWNLNHVLDPATGSSSLGLFKSYMLVDVDSGKKDKDGKPVMTTKHWAPNLIEKVDDHTVRLNLKLPQVAVPEHLDHYTNAMMDPASKGEWGPGGNGTGPFELAELVVGEKAVLRKRKDYWGTPANVDSIEFIDLGDDPAAVLGALASKQVHGVQGLDASQAAVAEKLPHLEMHRAVTANTAVVQMKVKRKPFDHPAVRKAFRYATDSQRVVDLATQGTGQRGEHHFVCPIHPDYAALPEMKRDPAKAKALLAEAGYPDGIDVEFNAKKDPSWELAAVQAMAEQWREAGIRAKINVMPSAQFWEVWDKFDLGFVEWAHRPLGFMVLSLGFRSGVPWNAPEYENPKLDALLDKAEATLDIEARKQVMKQIEILMQEDGPIVQPVWRGVATAYDKRVKGFTMHPKAFIFAHELAIES